MDFSSRIAALGGPVHYADFGGEGPPIVLVHGLGGSHLNWASVGKGLARHGRVRALDLAGFGLTPPAGRGSSVEANRLLLDRFLEEVVREPAVLVGNSMGATISLLEAGEVGSRVRGLVLVDPAVPRPRLSALDASVALAFGVNLLPGIAEATLRYQAERLGAEGLVREKFALCCTDPDRIDREVYDAHVVLGRERLARAPWRDDAFLEATRSLVALLVGGRRLAAAVARAPRETLIVHGSDDRLVPVAASQELVRQRSEWRLEVIPGVGHTPQLESPAEFDRAVAPWLARVLGAAAPAGGRALPVVPAP